jgi:prepilin-type processing-associated H-X9-DG protein
MVTTPSDTCLLIDNTQPWAGTWTSPTPQSSDSSTSSSISDDQSTALQDALGRHGQFLNVLYVDLHAAPIAYTGIPNNTQHALNTSVVFWQGTGTH